MEENVIAVVAGHKITEEEVTHYIQTLPREQHQDSRYHPVLQPPHGPLNDLPAKSIQRSLHQS